jgi:hypothetical protein
MTEDHSRAMCGMIPPFHDPSLLFSEVFCIYLSDFMSYLRKYAVIVNLNTIGFII